MLRLVSSSALDIDAASLASAALHSSTLAMSGRVVDREGVQAPLLPWVRPARPGRPLNRTAATGHTALASRTSALPPGRVGPVNEYANDAAGDEPIEGGAGIESEAGTRDQRQDPVSVEASVGQQE